jgi:hypothetical protein
MSSAATDRVVFSFPDATTFSVEVPAGEGTATVEAVIKRNGAYESGWVRDAADPTVFYNLGAAVRMQVFTSR